MDLVWPFSGAALWMLDGYRTYRQAQRRVRVLVHQAYFIDGVGASLLTTPPDMLSPVPATGTGGPTAVSRYYFVKVINVSPRRDIWITHVWFDAAPRVDIVLPQRPLPARLRPDETWEGWANAADLAHASNVERLGRVRLSNGKTVKSWPNKDVPPVGYIGGPGSPSA